METANTSQLLTELQSQGLRLADASAGLSPAIRARSASECVPRGMHSLALRARMGRIPRMPESVVAPLPDPDS